MCSRDSDCLKFSLNETPLMARCQSGQCVCAAGADGDPTLNLKCSCPEGSVFDISSATCRTAASCSQDFQCAKHAAVAEMVICVNGECACEQGASGDPRLNVPCKCPPLSEWDPTLRRCKSIVECSNHFECQKFAQGEQFQLAQCVNGRCECQKGAFGSPFTGAKCTCPKDTLWDSGALKCRPISGCALNCTNSVCGADGCGGVCGTCPDGQGCSGIIEGLCNCVPNCNKKTCGGDGCGGSCGLCARNQRCVNNVCVDCTPDCTGKACGSDGCGGSCGTCGAGKGCSNGLCINCESTCAGRVCGSDGCGGVCGVCPLGQDCTDTLGVCKCKPQCANRVCGGDGCGGSCGDCPTGLTCNPQGLCAKCTKQCVGRVCGDDGCFGSCGACGAGQMCNTIGQCVCRPKCENRTCGSDGCGGSCGTCPTGYACATNGTCVCQPNCAGRTCGPDGCGGSCGTCLPGTRCNTTITFEPNTITQSCVPCTPNCENKVCGDDDCSGSCGTCTNSTAPFCNPFTFQCTDCVPKCKGRQCGSDSCNGLCGMCPLTHSCIEGGRCIPNPPFRDDIMFVSPVGFYTTDCGTSSKPCASIGRAMTTILPNATLALYPGRYFGPENANIVVRFPLRVVSAASILVTNRLNEARPSPTPPPSGARPSASPQPFNKRDALEARNDNQFFPIPVAVIDLLGLYTTAFRFEGAAGMYGSTVFDISIVNAAPVARDANGYPLNAMIEAVPELRFVDYAALAIKNVTFSYFDAAIMVNGSGVRGPDTAVFGRPAECPLIDLHVADCKFVNSYEKITPAQDLVIFDSSFAMESCTFNHTGTTVLSKRGCGRSSIFESIFLNRTRTILSFEDGRDESLDIETCFFENNSGVAIYVNGKTGLAIRDSFFMNNTAALMDMTDTPSVVVDNTNFVRNHISERDGALMDFRVIENVPVVFTDCFVTNSSAPGSQSAALRVIGSRYGVVSLSNDWFLDNDVGRDIHVEVRTKRTEFQRVPDLYILNTIFERKQRQVSAGMLVYARAVSYSVLNSTLGPTRGDGMLADKCVGAASMQYDVFNEIAGEGLKVLGGLEELTLTNCSFVRNSGVAIELNTESLVNIELSEFLYNQRSCIWNRKVKRLDVFNTTFYHNMELHKDQDGGAYRGEVMPSETIPIRFIICRFANNTADHEGGAIFAKHQVLVDSCGFSRNRAIKGGAISIQGRRQVSAALTVRDSNFRRNIAYSQGGSINLSKSVAKISRTSFEDNSGRLGGAAHVDNNSFLYLSVATVKGNSAERGGGFYIEDDSDLVIRTAAIFLNTAEYGGGVHITEGSRSKFLANITIEDNVASEDCGGFFCRDSKVDRCERLFGLCDENTPQTYRCFSKCKVEAGDYCSVLCDKTSDGVDDVEGRTRVQFWVGVLIYVTTVLAVIVGLALFICLKY